MRKSCCYSTCYEMREMLEEFMKSLTVILKWLPKSFEFKQNKKKKTISCNSKKKYFWFSE